MGNIWSLNRSINSEDYEKVLSTITTRITEHETKLYRVRQYFRHWNILLLSYGGLLYTIILAYVFLYPRGPPTLSYRPLLDVLAVVLTPILLFIGRKLLGWVFRTKIYWLENRLKEYREEQKLKVEELKKATSYYKTKGLLERFDTTSSEGSSNSSKYNENSNGLEGKKKISDHQNELQKLINEQNPINLNPTMPKQMPFIHPKQYTPPPPLQHTWLDRLVDAIIGDDRGSRYALICRQCYTHNGLARPEDFDSAQYLCPNCNFLNLPRKVETGTVVLRSDSSSLNSNVGSTASTPGPPQETLPLPNGGKDEVLEDKNHTPKQTSKKSAALRRRSNRNKKTLNDASDHEVSSE